MKTAARGATLAALICLAGLPGAAEQARAREPQKELLRKIHILMVVDSNDEKIGEGGLVDEKRLRQMWERLVPGDRLTWKVLKGENARKQKILDHYKNLKLKVPSDEGIVFHYAGHGLLHPKTKKHVLALSNHGQYEYLKREDLVRAMEAKKAGLTVLITDCCSNSPDIRIEYESMDARQVGGKIFPTVSCLFFQSRGTVDITAATDNEAWSDPENGGVFTRAFCRMISTPVKDLDTDKDDFVDWNEFFGRVKHETENSFGSWKKHMLGRATPAERQSTVGKKLARRDLKQVPAYFKLPPRQASAGYLLVCVKNELVEPLHYQWRWGNGPWQKKTLEPGEKEPHTYRMREGNQNRPAFEFQRKGAGEPKVLDAEWWPGTAPPAPNDAKNLYSIRPKE